MQCVDVGMDVCGYVHAEGSAACTGWAVRSTGGSALAKPVFVTIHTCIHASQKRLSDIREGMMLGTRQYGL